MPLYNTMSGNNSNDVKTFEIIASFLLVLISGKLAFGVIYDEVVVKKPHEATRVMQSLAMQMESVKPIFKDNGGRGIASVINRTEFKDRALMAEGEIGRDPWGQPFRYKFYPSTANRHGYIVIVSGGPNAQFETNLSSLNFGLVEANKVSFAGDDLGYIKQADTSDNL